MDAAVRIKQLAARFARMQLQVLLALLVTGCLAEFGTRLPRQFVDTYEYAYGENREISAEQVESDLEILLEGAQNGFMPTPRWEALLLSALPQEALAPVLGWAQKLSPVSETAMSLIGYATYQAAFQQGLEEERYRESSSQAHMRKLEGVQKELHKSRMKMEAEKQKALEEERRLNEEGKKLNAERRRMEEEERARAEQRRRLAEEQERLRRQQWSFRASGDPRLCPHDSNGRVLEELCIEYKGPATVMCFDEFGMLQSVDFVGVCDEFGRNCQSMDAKWVGEQWRWDVQKKVFLYRNVSGQKVANVSCEADWVSEELPSALPPSSWLAAFNGGRSFLLHALQPRIADGPAFDFVWRSLVDQQQWDFDRDHVGQWINAMLMAHGYTWQNGLQQTAATELAKYAVFYGLAASRWK